MLLLDCLSDWIASQIRATIPATDKKRKKSMIIRCVTLMPYCHTEPRFHSAVVCGMIVFAAWVGPPFIGQMKLIQKIPNKRKARTYAKLRRIALFREAPIGRGRLCQKARRMQPIPTRLKVPKSNSLPLVVLPLS